MSDGPGGEHLGLVSGPLGVRALAVTTGFLPAWVCAAAAAAATLNVSTATDETTSGDHTCSLREAIAAANSPGTASDCGTAGSLSNTIVLGTGKYTLSVAPAGADDNASGDLNVSGTTPLTVSGASAPASVIDGSGLGDRVLSVAAGATVTLARLTITGAHAPAGANGANGTSSRTGPGGPGGAGSAGANGGGMLNLGSLTLTQVAVTNNRAGQGGTGGIGGSGFDRGAGAGPGGTGGAGGGIYSTGKLTLNGVAMSGNDAGQGGAGGQGGAANAGFNNQSTDGGGSGGAGGAGGSIDNVGTAATLTVTGSTISSGTSGTGGNGGTGGSGGPLNPGGFGGGGGASGGGADGGGVANGMGTVVVTRSTVFADVAGSGGSGGTGGPGSGLRTGGPGSGGPGGNGSSGGGIWSDGGSLSATNSTLYGNGAGSGGAGGPGASAAPGGNGGNGGNGGAIHVANGASSLLNLTVDGNQAGSGGAGGSTGGTSGAAGLGGGIFVQSASSGDNMLLQNTIVAASTRGASCVGSSPSAITDAGHDLSFPDTTCPGINGDPKLLTFKSYGGPTRTLGLASGSAAIDQVPATGAGCPATDQRGVKRPQGSGCDIGAFEFAIPQITITSPTNGATYTRGSPVLAAYRCSEGGITSPIATCNGTVANGQPIDTSSTGTKSFTVTATDKTGNQTTKTVTYTVTA